MTFGEIKLLYKLIHKINTSEINSKKTVLTIKLLGIPHPRFGNP